MDDQRREVLEQNVAPYAIKGYRVQSQGDRMAQLIKPQSRNGCLLIALLLLFWPAAIIYYMSAGDRQVLIEVNRDLSVTTTESGGFSKTTWWVIGIVTVIVAVLAIGFFLAQPPVI